MAGVSFGGHDIASPHFPAELSLPLSPIFLRPVRGEFPCLKGGIFPGPLGQGISARFLWPGFLSRPGLSARVLMPDVHAERNLPLPRQLEAGTRQPPDSLGQPDGRLRAPD